MISVIIIGWSVATALDAAMHASVPPSLEGLYREHHCWLNTWLQRRLACRASAEDLTQDTFVQVMGSELERIREPRAFLTTLAKRVLFNHYRRQDVERAYLDSLRALPDAVQPSEEERALALEALLAFAQALEDLPLRVRQAFLLAQLEEMPYAEIAQRLQISLATVKRYLARAHYACYFGVDRP